MGYVPPPFYSNTSLSWLVSRIKLRIELLSTAKINPAINLASTYPTQQIVDAKPLEYFFLVVHSFIGNAMYVCFPPHTVLAKIKLQVSIMVVNAECYQVASPFLSGKAIIWYHRMRKYRCAEGQHLTNQPTWTDPRLYCHCL